MNYTQISNLIKKEADAIIASKKLNSLFTQFGELIYTGSYESNLMTWPDIDMQIKLYPNQSKNKAITSILSHMIEDEDVIHAEYTNFSKKRDAKMPEGSYLQFRIKNNETIWKIDLWMLNEADFNQNREFMARKIELLKRDPGVRDLILEMKFELMANGPRPPKMASYYLYQAIVFDNLREKEEIKNYIRSKNVQII